MRKSFNSTLILLGVCGVLLAWYLGYEKKYKSQNKEAEEKAKQLVTLTSDVVQELEIERMTNAPPEGTPFPADFKPQYDILKLKKTGSEWSLAAPVEDAADSPSVSSIVNTLTTTKQDRVIDDKPKDLAPYGLNHPYLKLRIRKDSASKPEEVLVGFNTPVGYYSYVKTEGSAVYRAPRAIRTSFDRTVKDLRNKTVFPISRAEISEIEITPAGKPATLLKKKQDKDEWTLARENLPADMAEWNKTINALIDAKATDFPPSDPKELGKYGLTSPRAKVSVVKTDGTRLGLSVSQVKEKDKTRYFAKRDNKDTVYEIDKELLTRLEQPSTAYRSMQLAHFNRYDVDIVRIARGADKFELRREGPKWILAGDDKANVDMTKVDTLLTRLQDIKITKYLPEASAKPSAGSPALTITLLDRKDAEKPKDSKAPQPPSTEEELSALAFAKPAGKLVTGDRKDIPMAFQIKEDDYKSLLYLKEDFVQKEQKTETKPGNDTGGQKADEKRS